MQQNVALADDHAVAFTTDSSTRFQLGIKCDFVPDEGLLRCWALAIAWDLALTGGETSVLVIAGYVQSYV